MPSSESVTCRRLYFVNETEKAIQVCEKDGDAVWIPRSQITYLKRYMVPHGEGQRKECNITIPEWLANEKGLSGD